MAQKIRVAIIEDVKEVAENLKAIFNDEPDFQCNQVYFNAEEALCFLPKAPVDIALVGCFAGSRPVDQGCHAPVLGPRGPV